jgi:hypothetical protein
MNAAEILQQLRRAYAATPAYRDRGRVIFARGAADAGTTIVGEFQTTFARSRGFAFEYREIPSVDPNRDPSASRRYAVRVEQGTIVDARGFDPPGSVSQAIARLTGITFGAAHAALRLLLPDAIGGRALSDAPSAEVVSTEMVDGKTCFVVCLDPWSGRVIAVDEKFVLRRLLSFRPADATTRVRATVLSYEAELLAEGRTP